LYWLDTLRIELLSWAFAKIEEKLAATARSSY
jgi:hypothetical protein